MHYILKHLSGALLYGVAGATIFGETGVVALFFLPGDSMLFSLGMLAYDHVVSLETVILVVGTAAFLGNILGYYLGTIVRTKKDSNTILKKIPDHYIAKTEYFYTRYGVWAVFFSRFIPVVRTAGPFLAGVSRMNRKTFLLFSFIGAFLWPPTLLFLGYRVGPYFDIRHVEYISIGMMFFASVVTIIGMVIVKRKSRHTANTL